MTYTEAQLKRLTKAELLTITSSFFNGVECTGTKAALIDTILREQDTEQAPDPNAEREFTFDDQVATLGAVEELDPAAHYGPYGQRLIEPGESFGPTSPEEQQALQQRAAEIELMSPNERRELFDEIVRTNSGPSPAEEENNALPPSIAELIGGMIAEGTSKRAMARWLIKQGQSVADATKLLAASGVKIRYQQVYQATEGMRPERSAEGSCSVCGRPLSDPDHVAAGIGPVCQAKASIAGKSFKGNGK